MLAACGPAGGQEAPTRRALTGYPNLTIDHYDISGRTAQAIRRSIDRHPRRPRDPNDGRPMDAVARWSFRWSWPGDGRGGCELSRAQVEFSARVVMPRLTGEASVPAPVLARWRAYLAALAAHEDGHLAHAYRQTGAVLAALKASSCERANADAEAVLDTIRRTDVDYDRTTRHGETQGARFP